ncbi:hypothetical protein GOBAR_DD05996 [Gossypium barbadense]|nr:hypothetical protein GOBAR_DD05996 [Gossypium barbadense]
MAHRLREIANLAEKVKMVEQVRGDQDLLVVIRQQSKLRMLMIPQVLGDQLLNFKGNMEGSVGGESELELAVAEQSIYSMTSRLIRELLKHSRSGQFLIHVAGVLLEKIQPKVELMLTMGRVELLRLFWVLR